MREMLRRLKKYLERKRLMLNTEKNEDVSVRERGGRRRKERQWSWGEERIEEINEIRYLSYIMQKKQGRKTFIKQMQESNYCKKENMEFGREIIQGFVQEENEVI